ncbi:nucleotide-binding protein [Mycobacterium sp. 852013-50091_SCH5140682]|uniref:TIR domain-containing protein n=1 Tax=Mycobacterium sp. 852013-50091_SCH5140682 TaxID=1834109 RepID=UPI000B2D6B1D|nr:nucleotide-binding protein [Mycobacterium sp. 852013-50091_SCH5140682]
MPPSKSRKVELIEKQIAAAKDGDPDDFSEWRTTTEAVLRHTVGEGSTALAEFRENRYSLSVYSTGTPQSAFDEARRRGIKRGIGYLRAAIAEVEMQDEDAPETPFEVAVSEPGDKTAIFIVHGRNSERKETVARFVRNLTGIEPIILHEQVSGGSTILEKLEKYAATAGFAIVLATGDDLGRAATDTADRPRARQNVVFEMGYFFALLGRDRVVMLYDADVETPSDLDGLVYVEVDARGAWKIDLTREIEAAGLKVDRTALR